MKIEIIVDDKQLLNVLTSANIGDWGKWGPKVTETGIKKVLKGTATAQVIEVDEQTEAETLHLLSQGGVMQGIQIMATKYPHKLKEIMDDTETDMYSGEFLIQLALFGEEKYA